MRKNLVGSLSNKIVELVRDRSKGIPLDGNVEVDHTDEQLPEHLSSIRIYRISRLSRSSCHTPGGTSIPRLGPEHLQELIDEKNSKVTSYLTRCDQVNLIIEIHGFQLSSVAELDDSVLTHTFEHRFSNVLVLIDGNKLVELKNRAAPT